MEQLPWFERADCRGLSDIFIIPLYEHTGDSTKEQRLRRVEEQRNASRIKDALAVCATCPVRAECEADMLSWNYPPTRVVVAGMKPHVATSMWHRKHPEWKRQNDLMNENASRERAKERRQHGNISTDRVRRRARTH